MDNHNNNRRDNTMMAVVYNNIGFLVVVVGVEVKGFVRWALKVVAVEAAVVVVVVGAVVVVVVVVGAVVMAAVDNYKTPVAGKPV